MMDGGRVRAWSHWESFLLGSQHCTVTVEKALFKHLLISINVMGSQYVRKSSDSFKTVAF